MAKKRKPQRGGAAGGKPSAGTSRPGGKSSGGGGPRGAAGAAAARPAAEARPQERPTGAAAPRAQPPAGKAPPLARPAGEPGSSASRPAGAAAALAAARSSASRTAAAPAPAPAGGLALEISSAKLALARFAFFVILSLDALMQVPHAPRYGLGGFNVAHLPGLLGPDRGTYLVLQCGIACLAMLVAVGTGGRAVAVTLAAAYGWAYFGSQLDSYQHHYLVWLLLCLWCFLPQPPPAGAPPPAQVRSPVLRLIVLQLGILYLWAAISKLEPKWLDGTAMSLQIHGLVRQIIDATVGIKIGSRLIIVSELVLAVTIWRVRGWRWAWPIGMGMHGTIAFTGLEIGLFSYMMMSLYLLIVPEPYASRVIDAVVARVPAGWRRRARHGDRRVAVALIVTAWLLFATLRPPLQSWVVGLFLLMPVLLTIGWSWSPRFATRAALAAALSMASATAVDALAHITTDYYRYWAGAARRVGQTAEAEEAYRNLVEVAPELEVGHYYLGRMLVRGGALEQGLVHLREAEVLDPSSTRALDEMARALAAAGRKEEASAAAARAQARRELLLGPPGSIAPGPVRPGGGTATTAPPSGSKNDETDENVEVDVEDEPER